MAVLKDHPLTAEFQTRGTAITLLKRKLSRPLNDNERNLFAKHPLLKGLVDAAADVLASTVAKLEAEQEAAGKALADEASAARRAAHDKHHGDAIAAAKAKHGNASDDDLTKLGGKLRKAVRDARAQLAEVRVEQHRRRRVARLAKLLNVTSETDKQLLADVIGPNYLPAQTKINAP